MMRIGLLRLTDAAPVIMARELSLFAEEGAEVSLSVEPSWANIADKLAHGVLDAAVIVPPLAFAIVLGLRGVARRLVVPQTLSLGGNTITLESSLARLVDERLQGRTGPLERARAFADVLKGLPEKLSLAVVHVYSTHNLLLRYWLAAAGIDPDWDVHLVVVPPVQTVEALADGTISGFCAGAPWGAIAEARGIGISVASSHDVWRNGPEKAFAVREDWALENDDELQAVLRALLKAGQFCDDPASATLVSRILSEPTYVGVDAEVIRHSLPGQGGASSVFFDHAATVPWLSQAEWFLQQMMRWGLARDFDPIDVAQQVYRPDLYARAAMALGLSVPRLFRKEEGHAAPWELAADPAPIAMRLDGFCNQL